MIGGLAVNHWAQEPLATAHVDVVIARERVDPAVKALEAAGFQAKRFEWSINLQGSSKVSVQISIEDFYQDFPSRSVSADVHGILMRVAALKDTLAGKIAAWSDTQRRPSKRQKDLLDLMRLVESHPQLKYDLPPELLTQISGTKMAGGRRRSRRRETIFTPSPSRQRTNGGRFYATSNCRRMIPAPSVSRLALASMALASEAKSTPCWAGSVAGAPCEPWPCFDSLHAAGG